MPKSKTEVRQSSDDLIDYVGLVFGPIESILGVHAQERGDEAGYAVKGLVEITHKRMLRLTELLEEQIGTIEVVRERRYGALAGEILGVEIEKGVPPAAPLRLLQIVKEKISPVSPRLRELLTEAEQEATKVLGQIVKEAETE